MEPATCSSFRTSSRPHRLPSQSSPTSSTRTKNKVLYVQDVHPATGATIWSHVFLADLSQPANPGDVTTAQQAVVTAAGPPDAPTTRLHMINAGEHELSPTDPDAYHIQTFDETDLPLQLDSQDATHISRVDTPLHAPARELWQRARTTGASTSDARTARIELNYRFSFPFACLVLMLIGVPLGLHPGAGAKAPPSSSPCCSSSPITSSPRSA